MIATMSDAIYLPMEGLEPHWDDISPLINIPNRAKAEARKRRQYGWEYMPDYIELWDVDDGRLVVPRGVRDPLANGFAELGVDVTWVDERASDRLPQVWPRFPQYRSFQEPGAIRMIECEEGIVEAPAGSGKSVLGLEVVRRARERWNIVVVNEIGIAKQWLGEAEEFLGPGYGYGLIGAGKWQEGRLTVATLQTLYSRLDDIPPEWWARWGVALLDECHHQTARTFIDVMGRFHARIRGGLSATPDKTGDFDIAQAVLGDVVYRVTRHQLREEGILMRPEVRVVETGFSYGYWPDHQVTKKEGYECQMPGCPKSGRERHGHRNNYAKMLKALVEDRGRNDVVAARIKLHEGERQIVVSKQVKQLEAIREAMERAGVESHVVWLVGGLTEEQREDARSRVVATQDVVLMTTIADEAFNAPPLRVGHAPFPTRNTGAVKQRIGRVERAWPGKRFPVWYDYRDDVGVLISQYGARRWEVYAPEMYKVVDHTEA